MSNTQLPADVLVQVEKDAEAAYKELYEKVLNLGDGFALPKFNMITDPIVKGISEYATKLHQVEQEKEEERRQRVYLEMENDVITDNYNKAQQEIESLKRWKMEAVELLTPINAYVHKHMEKGIGQSCVTLILDRCKHFEQARTLLEEALHLLSGTSPIHDKIQTFLDDRALAEWKGEKEPAKLTTEQIEERKEAIEWFRNPAAEAERGKETGLDVREKAEQWFKEEVSKIDDERRKEEVLLEDETYIGVWMQGYRASEEARKQRAVWVKASERPLIRKKDNGNWVCTDDGDKEFIAAVPYLDKRQPGKTFWWIRHCVIENGSLCVVGDDDNTPAGWDIDGIEYWMPWPCNPDESAGEKEVIDLPAFVQYIRENYKPSKEVWKDKFGIALLSDEGVITMYKSQKKVKP